MNNLTLSDILQLITSAGIIIALLANAGTIRQRNDNKVAEQAEMKADIKYIKEKMEKIDGIQTGLTEVQQSCKSAHKRISEHLERDHGQRPVRSGDDQ